MASAVILSNPTNFTMEKKGQSQPELVQTASEEHTPGVVGESEPAAAQREQVEERGNEQIDRPMDERENEQLDRPMDERENQQVDKPLDERENKHVDKHLYERENEQVDKPLDERQNEQLDKPVDEPKKEKVDPEEGKKQPEDERKNEQENEPRDERKNEPMDERKNEQENEPMNERKNEQENEPMDERKNEHKNEPMNERNNDQEDEHKNEPLVEPMDVDEDHVPLTPKPTLENVTAAIDVSKLLENTRDRLQELSEEICAHRTYKLCRAHKKCAFCHVVEPPQCWPCNKLSLSRTPPEYRELEELLLQGTPAGPSAGTSRPIRKEPLFEAPPIEGPETETPGNSSFTSAECIDLTAFLDRYSSCSSNLTLESKNSSVDPVACVDLTKDTDSSSSQSPATKAARTDDEITSKVEEYQEPPNQENESSNNINTEEVDPILLDINIGDTVSVPNLNPEEYKAKMVDLNDKLECTLTENADLRLQLNAAQQAKAALELEIGKKDEMILKTEAEALKREQNYKQEIKQLREQLKENTKTNENEDHKELEEQLKLLKMRESKLLAELSQKTTSEAEAQQLLESYSRTISNSTSYIRKLEQDLESQKTHLANMEIAFSDVHRKYENTKECLKMKTETEEALTMQLSLQTQLRKQDEERYEALKAHAHSQIDKANRDNNNLKLEADDKIAKLNAIVRRLDIKIQSLDMSLQQKTKECEALASLCDEVTGKKRSS